MSRRSEFTLPALLFGSLLTVTGALLVEAKASKPYDLPGLVREGRQHDAAGVPRTLDFVTDATGHRLRVAQYQRIASCSSIADAILPDLIGTHRIVAVNRWYAETNPNARRLGDKPRLDRVEELETILALKPDLVLVSNYSGENSSIERLREEGLAVFDLGPMRGQVTLEVNYRSLGALLGLAGDGERMALAFKRRMQQVAAHIDTARRKRALYLNQFDTQLHGGTLGSSYYDVLTAAGLIDLGATGKHFDSEGSGAWPKYRVEDILLMKPDTLVTVVGKGRSLCATAGLDSIPACREPNGIVELPEGLLNDPGPGMLGAAEALCDKVYGKVE